MTENGNRMSKGQRTMSDQVAKSQNRGEEMGKWLLEQLTTALGDPKKAAILASRSKVTRWFVQTAPLIRWDVIDSPLGRLYIAANDRGLCGLDFGISQADFIRQLDPMAHTEQARETLAPVSRQLQEYFAGERLRFDIPLDLERMTSFQANVLQAARRIPAGSVRTYGEVAKTIGKPRASRAVGQALGRNPLPIVIPCHRVIGSDGSLGGYSGSGGLESKRYLLTLEGAL
jgi:methylated-DNA-[protein]-cysteine S-methyltransferase